jgi:CDP-diacylglycerol--glycerol-3-phosphate 3-phosphatidyltransferase
MTWPYRFGLAGLLRAGLRPWHLTLLSLVGNVIAGWLLLTGRRLVPAVVLAVAGMLDIFDGGVARARGEASRWGAFLDSTLDRVADVIVFGALFWSLAGQGHRLAAGLALVALVASFMVSHLRAEAEAVGVALTEGVVQRLERYLLLLVGLLVPGALLPVLAVLAVLGILTAVQRAWSAWHRAASGPADRQPT